MFTAASKEKPGIPLPAMVAAVWGGFLFEGLFAVGTEGGQRRMQDVLAAWGQGCIELVIGASVLLPVLWREVCTVWESSQDQFPGVLEYEVVSELGTWLGEQVLASGKLPDQEAVQGEIRRLVEAFFAQEHEDGAGAGVGTGADTSSGTITAAIATPGERPCVLRP